MGVGRVGDRYVPASAYQVREDGTYLYPTMEWGKQGRVSRRSFPQEDSGLQRRLALSPSPSLSLPLALPLCSTEPSSPNPSILAPSPTQPLSQGSGSNSTTTTRHTTSIAQRTASVSAWDSLPPPPPPSLLPESSRGTCPCRRIPAKSKVPPAPPCSCPAPYPVTPPPFRLPVAFPPPNDDDGLGL